MDDIYENTDEYNPNKKWKILIAFDYMIADKLNNRNFNPVVTELSITCRELNISVFARQPYCSVPKIVTLNCTYDFIMKIRNKREILEIAINLLSDIDFKDFMKLYQKSTSKPYSFLLNDITFGTNNPLSFRRIF